MDKNKTFMEISKIVAERSKDPSKKNGAVIVSFDGRTLSTGYNGFPFVEEKYGNNDEVYPWTKSDDFEKDRLSYVVHAEANAILNFRGYARELEDSTIYTTQIPCNECAKLIVQSGIKNVVYLEDEDKPRARVARKIMNYAGVKLSQYNEE